MSGFLYVISGPSGAGKSTIITRVRKKLPELVYSISHTSRRPRGNEQDAVHYHFVDRRTFLRMIEEGAFLEWAEVYGEYYGTSLSSLNDQLSKGYDVLMDLDSQGAQNIKKNIAEPVLVYILPPSLEVLEKRLRKRATDDEQVMITRISSAAASLQECLWYDYIIINDDLDKAVEAIEAIIISHQFRSDRMRPKAERILMDS
ncbi:guanylate kinase [Thermodesulfobacteriota bacterium]